jgi:hypothetical protein
VLQCARPGAAWVEFEPGGVAAGSSPYALYTTNDGGTSWQAVLEGITPDGLVHAPTGPGSYPAPFSVIDPTTAFFVGYSPAADSLAGVTITNGKDIGPTRTIVRFRDSNPSHYVMFDADAVSFADRDHGLAIGSENSISPHSIAYTTADGGVTWTRADVEARLSSAAPSCRSGQLRAVGIKPIEPISQRHPVAFVFENRTDSSCTIDGYPTMLFADARGNHLGFSMEHDGGTMSAPNPPHVVSVPPNGLVFAVADKNTCVEGPSGAAARSVRISLPGGAGTEWMSLDSVSSYEPCPAGDPGRTVNVFRIATSPYLVIY